MICRPALSRGSQLALRRQGAAKVAQRSFAAVASPKASYEPTNIAGVKVASRDDNGPTTRLAIVAKAGTRYEPLPGLTVGLEEYAFKAGLSVFPGCQSGRECGHGRDSPTDELICLSSAEHPEALRAPHHPRVRAPRRPIERVPHPGSPCAAGQLPPGGPPLLRRAPCRGHRGDAVHQCVIKPPSWSEIACAHRRCLAHEFHEEVVDVIHQKQARLDAAAIALDAAHSVAFHTGLGAPLYPTTSTPVSSYLNESSVAAFADAAYTKANIAVIADGASEAGLSKWIEPFFKAVPAQSPSSVTTAASKYYGGEQRVAKTGPNSLVIAFPGAALGANQPETAVLVGLLGGESTIKWSPGFALLSKATAAAPGATAQASNYAYSDAGLLTIQINGQAAAVRKAAEEAVKALQSVVEGGVSQENLVKAIAKAKFDLLSASEVSGTGLVHAGANLIHGGQPLQVVAAIKALEGVTGDKLKAVSDDSMRCEDDSPMLTRCNNRRPRHY